MRKCAQELKDPASVRLFVNEIKNGKIVNLERFGITFDRDAENNLRFLKVRVCQAPGFGRSARSSPPPASGGRSVPPAIGSGECPARKKAIQSSTRSWNCSRCR